MRELTKKPRIDAAHLLMVSCPAPNVARVMAILKNNGCLVNDTTAQAIPAPDDEFVAHVPPAEAPGIYLRGLRCREDLTQEEFARRVGIPRRHISEMENNKRPIGKINARRIAEVFAIDPRIFWI